MEVNDWNSLICPTLMAPALGILVLPEFSHGSALTQVEVVFHMCSAATAAQCLHLEIPGFIIIY